MGNFGLKDARVMGWRAFEEDFGQLLDPCADNRQSGVSIWGADRPWSSGLRE